MSITDKIQSLQSQVHSTYVKPPLKKIVGFEEALQKNEEALKYLRADRNLTDETIKNFRLGYDSYNDAISIPIFKSGELVNIKYRLLSPGKRPKYTQEKDAEVWLYNEEGIRYAEAKKSILIVEGEFDLMSCWQAGIKNVISPASGKDSYGVWIELLDNIKTINIAYDNDAGGKETAAKMAERFGTEKCREVIYPPEIKDANQYFRDHTLDDYRDLVKLARPFYAYQFKGVVDVINNLRNDKDEYITLEHLPDVKLGKDWLIVMSGKSNVGKCHGKGTEIMMYDGTYKKVEDVEVGDKLMGPHDNKPKKVLSLARGKEEMYRIHQRGEYYDVNESHILSTQKLIRNKYGKYDLKEFEFTVKHFLDYSPHTQKQYRGWRSPVNYDEKFFDKQMLDPYFLGIWLGDGTSSKTQVTTADKVIEDFLVEYAESLGLEATKRDQKNNASIMVDLINKTRKSNYILRWFRNYNLIENKHIPRNYMVASYEDRSSLLAGLIDSDGHLAKTTRGESYEIIQKNEVLANDIVALCRSLGFRATMKKCVKGIKSIGFKGSYFRINIVGKLGDIPVKLERKKSNFIPKKNWLTSNIKVESLGVGDYYGFTLDGDGLYLLKDFTVTHNTSYIMNLVDELTNKDIPVLVLPFERGPEVVGKRFLQVKYNMAEGDFAGVTDDVWNTMVKDCLHTPLYFSMPTKDETMDVIKKSKRIFNTRVVIIDHLDYMIRTSYSKEQEIGQTLQNLKRLAEEHKIIMIVVTHVRKVDGQGSQQDRKPGIEDLKGSASLYQDPECVVMLSSVRDSGSLTVDVVKNKGRMSEQDYQFNLETGKLGLPIDKRAGDNDLDGFEDWAN